MIDSRYTRDDLLKLAGASPQAVLRHDKQTWLSLFANKAVVEDPVGTSPHEKHDGQSDDALDRFYETFIAPNQITFNVHADIVCVDTVMRDVDIEIIAPSGLVTSVHCYAMYEIVEEAGQLKIDRLAAHWELLPMVKQVLGSGIPGLKMMTSLGLMMPRIQGISGVLGYMRGFGGIRQKGKNVVQQFVKAFNEGNTTNLTSLFGDDSEDAIELPAGKHNLITDLLTDWERTHLTVSGLISSGMTTSFRFDLSLDGVFRHGIGLFEFSGQKDKLKRVRFFWNE